MDIKDINKQLELSDKQINILLDTILKDPIIKDKIEISNNIYIDTKIDEWFKKKQTTLGGKIIAEYIIKNPIINKELLLKRQNINFEIFNYQLNVLKNNEKDILWIMTLKKEIDENLSINLLFPSLYWFNNLNEYHLFLNIYHIYKIFFMPLSCLLYPLSIIFGPYYYLTAQLKLTISLSTYFYMMYECLKILFKPTGNFKKDIFKLITLFIYIFVYIYSIYQTFILAYVVYKTRERLLEKMKGLVTFIKTSIILIKSSKNIWKHYYLYDYEFTNNNEFIERLSNINYDLSSIYKLWKRENFKEDIIKLLKIIYTLDVINSITKLKKLYVKVNYITDTNSKIWNIKNPLLEDNQVVNPVSLEKNIIITGVNAGGKTTYVKSIASNIILSQTIGLVYGYKADLLIYDAIISFMRLNDEVGIKSYFEAETECCNNMIICADKLKNTNKHGLFLLDEPMHSTPPIEGVSVAYSIIKYLGKINNIRTIITTHYHKLIELEEQTENNNFINLHVNANKINVDINKHEYVFDYKIRRGGSKQTIAIELLEKHKFNDEIINYAIEIKNKLCNDNLRNDF